LSNFVGTTTGNYTIDITVASPQEFVISAERANLYADGQQFEIYQTPDTIAPINSGTRGSGALTPRSRTFEFFVLPRPYSGDNIPIFISQGTTATEDTANEVAVAIANAINSSQLTNSRQLFIDGVASGNPLERVSATLLGDVNEVVSRDPQPGLRILRPEDSGVAPGRPVGADTRGRTARFIKVENAAAIDTRMNGSQPSSMRVDPDLNSPNQTNIDQIIPETGVMVSGGSSPTLLNNVFFNVQTPIVREETRLNGFGVDADELHNLHPRLSQVVVGGSVYQYSQPNSSLNLPVVIENRSPGNALNLRVGIEASPTNVPETALDFNLNLDVDSNGAFAINRQPLFVNAINQEYLPRNLSRLIDSSIDSLTERAAFRTIKEANGIGQSPILAPSRDAFGQLRIDDPSVSPPSGIGSNIFKDRGALDRADRIGPTARFTTPTDNDALFVDSDRSRNSLRLTPNNYNEFRIQLIDTLDTEDPFPGVGIDDNSVLNVAIAPKTAGAVLTLRENGRSLVEGVDYVFSYNSANKELILTPLGGVWRNEAVYELTLNNRDRYVVQFSGPGNQFTDGSVIQITDSSGGITNFEFESGYVLEIPRSLRLILPESGAGLGGVGDADTFTITVPGSPPTVVTFEIDFNGNFFPGNRPINVLPTDTRAQLADKLLAAIVGQNLAGLSVEKLADNSIFIGGNLGTTVSTTGRGLSIPKTSEVIKVPTAGPLPGGIVDGQTFSVNDGLRTVVFEIDSDRVLINASNQRVDISISRTASDVADQILAALLLVANSPDPNLRLNIRPAKVGIDSIFVGLPDLPTSNFDLASSRLSRIGTVRSMPDGQSFTITYSPNGGATVTKTFEFDSNGQTSDGAQGITALSSENDQIIGERIEQAINNHVPSFNLNAIHTNDGFVTIGGTREHRVQISNGNSIALSGLPGVSGKTSLAFNGAAVLQPPSNLGAILDGSFVRILGNSGQAVTFEFDSNNQVANFNVPVRFNPSTGTIVGLSNALANAIRNVATLGLTPTVLSDGRIDLGFTSPSRIFLTSESGFQLEGGIVRDGEVFSVSNGTSTMLFEFVNTSVPDGRRNDTSPIFFSNESRLAEIVQSTKTAIVNAQLGLTSASITNLKTTFNNDTLQLDDTPRFRYDLLGAPNNLTLTGIPGGAVPVRFVRSVTFTNQDVTTSFLQAIRSLPATTTNLRGNTRTDTSIFLENATSIDFDLQAEVPVGTPVPVQSYFLGGIKDLAGNNLRSNRVNLETEFTVVMSDGRLDFGDAPDPFTTTAARYPTLLINNGARHPVLGNDEIQVFGWTSPQQVAGTFTLSFDGQTTIAIPAPASAASVQSRLEALSNIGIGLREAPIDLTVFSSSEICQRRTLANSLSIRQGLRSPIRNWEMWYRSFKSKSKVIPVFVSARQLTPRAMRRSAPTVRRIKTTE
jgi:large repetitive protein